MIKKILLLWYMVEDNFGDVLLSHTVSSLLKENGFEVEFHEVGDNGRKIFEHANQCDFMLFAGGGIIERYVPDVIQNFKKNSDMLTVPYGVMGFGMGNFDYTIFEEALSFWVDNAEFFYVRDEATKKQLDNMAQNKQVIYSADCVFGNKEIRYIRKGFGTLRGINLRDVPYKDITGDFDWSQMSLLLNQIKINNIIPDSSKEIEQLQILPGTKDYIVEYKQLNPIDKVKVTIEKIISCDWIVAMRFHVVLVAAMVGIASVPIMYCPKVEYLAEQLGIKNLAVGIEEIEKIPEKIAILENEKEKYLRTIEKHVLEFEQRADKMFGEVVLYLKSLNKSI